MMDSYLRCASFLQLDNRPNVGVTVVISMKWYFLAVVNQPYAHAENGNPVYLDGFDFTGLMTL